MTDATPIESGWGGKRPGQGRPRGSVTPDSARYTKARADTQEAVAKIKDLAAMKASLELNVRKGQLVEAADVEETVAEFVGIVVGFLAPLADRLGRDCGLDGAVVGHLYREVDVVRTELQALLNAKFGVPG